MDIIWKIILLILKCLRLPILLSFKYMTMYLNNFSGFIIFSLIAIMVSLKILFKKRKR